jgi:transposase
MWATILNCIAGNVLIASICLAIATYKGYKKQEREIEEYKAIIKQLDSQLKTANKKIETLMWSCGNKTAKEQIMQKQKQMQKQAQYPDFLQADDPMEALLKGVGKVNR